MAAKDLFLAALTGGVAGCLCTFALVWVVLTFDRRHHPHQMPLDASPDRVVGSNINLPYGSSRLGDRVSEPISLFVGQAEDDW